MTRQTRFPLADHDDRRFVLCFIDDTSVVACRGLRRAELSIEARDVASWRVHDDELFIHDVKVDLDRNVSIGDRSGGTVASEDVPERMRDFLRRRRADRQWTDVPFDSLFEAIEEVNRADDAAALRRARVLGLIICLAVAVLVTWRVARWLTAR
jgi:hypothetical protein